MRYTDSKIFAATNVHFKPAQGLSVTPEVAYINFDSIDKDVGAGVLRIERKF